MSGEMESRRPTTNGNRNVSRITQISTPNPSSAARNRKLPPSRESSPASITPKGETPACASGVLHARSIGSSFLQASVKMASTSSPSMLTKVRKLENFTADIVSHMLIILLVRVEVLESKGHCVPSQKVRPANPPSLQLATNLF